MVRKMFNSYITYPRRNKIDKIGKQRRNLGVGFQIIQTDLIINVVTLLVYHEKIHDIKLEPFTSWKRQTGRIFTHLDCRKWLFISFSFDSKFLDVIILCLWLKYPTTSRNSNACNLRLYCTAYLPAPFIFSKNWLGNLIIIIDASLKI